MRTWNVDHGSILRPTRARSMRLRGYDAAEDRLVMDWSRISFARPPSLQRTR